MQIIITRKWIELRDRHTGCINDNNKNTAASLTWILSVCAEGVTSEHLKLRRLLQSHTPTSEVTSVHPGSNDSGAGERCQIKEINQWSDTASDCWFASCFLVGKTQSWRITAVVENNVLLRLMDLFWPDKYFLKKKKNKKKSGISSCSYELIWWQQLFDYQLNVK